MTNKEKYGKEILDIACTGDRVAMRNSDNVIVGCRKLECLDFAFNTHGKGCNDAIEEWTNSEYVEPPVDWSKVAVDTPIFVRDSIEEMWKKDILQNTRTEWCAHGDTEQHLGAWTVVM